MTDNIFWNEFDNALADIVTAKRQLDAAAENLDSAVKRLKTLRWISSEPATLTLLFDFDLNDLHRSTLFFQNQVNTAIGLTKTGDFLKIDRIVDDRFNFPPSFEED